VSSSLAMEAADCGMGWGLFEVGRALFLGPVRMPPPGCASDVCAIIERERFACLGNISMYLLV